MSRAMNIPRTASKRIAARRARLGTLAAQPAIWQRSPMPARAVVRTRKRSRLGLLLLMASALFFTYFFWV
jgi:hypothetical protein